MKEGKKQVKMPEAFVLYNITEVCCYLTHKFHVKIHKVSAGQQIKTCFLAKYILFNTLQNIFLVRPDIFSITPTAILLVKERFS